MDLSPTYKFILTFAVILYVSLVPNEQLVLKVLYDALATFVLAMVLMNSESPTQQASGEIPITDSRYQIYDESQGIDLGHNSELFELRIDAHSIMSIREDP